MSEMAQPIHPDTERFARNLARLTQPYGSTKQIAEAAGIGPDHVWKISQGKNVPTLDLAIRIAHAANIPIEKMLNDELPEPATAKSA